MSNCNTIDDKVIDRCMSIINAETKPAKIQSSKKLKLGNEIRVKLGDLDMNKLRGSSDTSDLEELFKTL